MELSPRVHLVGREGGDSDLRLGALRELLRRYFTPPANPEDYEIILEGGEGGELGFIVKLRPEVPAEPVLSLTPRERQTIL